MHVFKLSMTAGAGNPRMPAGTVAKGLCLVNYDAASVEVARDRALLELNRHGWQSCTFEDLAQLPPSPNVAAFSPAMQTAYTNARQYGAALIVYPPSPTAG